MVDCLIRVPDDQLRSSCARGGMLFAIGQVREIRRELAFVKAASDDLQVLFDRSREWIVDPTGPQPSSRPLKECRKEYVVWLGHQIESWLHEARRWRDKICGGMSSLPKFEGSRP